MRDKKTIMNKIIKHTFIGLVAASFLFSAFSISSCRKLVETDPPSDRLTGTNVFLADGTAIGVLNGIYQYMHFPLSGSAGLTARLGMSADELTLFNGVINPPVPQYYKNELAGRFNGGTTTSGGEFWSPFYGLIYKCNDAIDGLNKSTKLSPGVKQQLLGEAKFIRAFHYFYLVNLFGDVPLAITTDPEINRGLGRSAKEKVYEQIMNDLKEAEELLSSNYLDGTLLKTTSERVRPTKWAAAALLARVYLYTGDWGKAEERANLVIENTSLFGPLPAINNVFLKNSTEAIWQLQPTNLDFNTDESRFFVIPPTGPNVNNPVKLSKALLGSFELNDLRRVFGNWVDTTIYTVSLSPLVRDTIPYVYKYKIFASPGVSTPAAMLEYVMVLRLGEQYLIRAEARTHLGKIEEAQSDLNAIRTRAGLPNTTAGDQPTLLTAILDERRHELFCEGGHRWLDLKRTGKIDEVMNVVTPIKSDGATNWRAFQALYPIPYSELQLMPSLTQNPGYQ